MSHHVSFLFRLQSAFAVVLILGGAASAQESTRAVGDVPSAVSAQAEMLDGQWTWVPVDGAQCRDGSPTGISVRSQVGSDDLLIHLGGGPMCIDGRSCTETGPQLIDSAMNQRERLDIFANRPENPFRQWNYVFVPQCTGDLHAGKARDVVVPGVENAQQFVGHANMSLFVDRIKASFPNPTRVVLAGIGSGAQGAMVNFPDVRRAFEAETPMTLLIDSGPPIPQVETRGIFRAMSDYWRADETLMSECRDACGDPTNLFFDYFVWLADTYSGDLDIILTAFGNDPVEAAELGISEVELWSYIESVDARILPTAGLYHFYADTTGHAFTGSGMYDSPTVAGYTFARWLTEVLAGELLHVRGAH